MNADEATIRFWVEARAQDMVDRGWDQGLLIETLMRISEYPEMKFQPIGNLLNVLRVVMIERSIALGGIEHGRED